MQKDEEVGKVAQATPVVICVLFDFYALTYMLINIERLRAKRDLNGMLLL